MPNGLTSGTVDQTLVSPLSFTAEGKEDKFFSWEATLTNADDPFFRVEPAVLFQTQSGQKCDLETPEPRS